MRYSQLCLIYLKCKSDGNRRNIFHLSSLIIQDLNFVRKIGFLYILFPILHSIIGGSKYKVHYNNLETPSTGVMGKVESGVIKKS